jgi:chemotaxis protein CheD
VNKTTVTDEVIISMAGIGISNQRGKMRTLLGSCIGVALYDRKLKLLGLAHVVLPDSNGSTQALGKYADTAIPETIRRIALIAQSSKLSLTAKIAGGANMFSHVKSNSMNTIGDQNIVAVERVLASYQIPVLGKHLGGTFGRRMVVYAENGEVEIHVVGQPVVLL